MGRSEEGVTARVVYICIYFTGLAVGATVIALR